MFSWYVAHVFFKWLWNSPSRPYYYWYHLWFYIPLRGISIVRSLYFRIFSAPFLITFLSPEIATSINIHVPFSLLRIVMSGLLLGIIYQFIIVDSTILLPCLLDLFLLILAHVHTSVFCPIVPLFPCICWSVAVHTLYHVFFASIGHADIMWSIVSSSCWQSLHLLSVSVFNIFVVLLVLLYKALARTSRTTLLLLERAID